jgi:hypothetical protein
MLNRLRASVAGDNSAPDSPRHTTTSSQQQQHNAAAAHNNVSPATPQKGSGLFGFLKQPSVDLPPPPSNAAAHHHNSHDKGVTPMGPSAGGFFGGLIGGGGGSGEAPPSPMEPDSPRTIRASAAALLRFSTTPPLFNAAETNNNGDGSDNAINKRLEDQINKRDQHIMKLEHDLQKMQQQHNQLTKDNTTIRRQQLESTHRHAVAIRLWRRTNDGLSSRVDCFEKETTAQAAREIAQLIRDAAPPNKDSAYLMMLQDQLAKATTKLDHLASQTEIVLHKGEEVVESLREEMNEVIRERCRMEIELMDQEYMLGEDMKRLVLRAERRLKRVMGEIDFLEKNAVEALKNQEEEEEEEEEEEGKDDDNDDEGENSPKEEEAGETETKNKEADDGDQETDTKTTESTTQPADEEDDNRASNNKQDNNNNNKKEQQTPEVLRQELRKIAMERDRCLSVLQKKLRDKNEEFNALMKLKESRTKEINKIEMERREREEWKRGRQEIIP